MDVKQFVETLDGYLKAERLEEAGRYLEESFERAKDEGDWRTQITILNEMMGFYRSVGESEPGLASVYEGVPADRGARNAGDGDGGNHLGERGHYLEGLREGPGGAALL